MNKYRIERWNQDDEAPESGILIIRHGPREGGSFPPSDAPLTNQGRQECIQLGEGWTGVKPNVILTSPSDRCKETAHLVGQGAGWDVDILESTLLGYHGPFVVDLKTVSQLVRDARKGEDTSFLRRHVAGEDVPGMLNRDVGSQRMLTDLSIFKENGGLLVAVSHDSIIAALLGYGGKEPEPWPEPLCGAWIIVTRNCREVLSA